MKTFTPFQYLMIDCANHFGLDKLTFEERIKWVDDNLNTLEQFQSIADNKPMFAKTVMAIRKAQAGEPTGHLVSLDAVCSGLQIMSVVTGCIVGAETTGLVNPNVRADAYSSLTNVMNKNLGTSNQVSINRADAKEALMTSLYGSKAVPERIFGEDTPELEAFYTSVKQMATGAWELLQDCLDSWQPYAKSHQWILPDGFNVRIKVLVDKESRIEVDELDKATFTYYYTENEGKKTGVSNAANIVHSERINGVCI